VPDTLTGPAAGVLPARRAAQMEPVDALRAELGRLPGFLEGGRGSERGIDRCFELQTTNHG
jgi:hypothetical protein